MQRLTWLQSLFLRRCQHLRTAASHGRNAADNTPAQRARQRYFKPVRSFDGVFTVFITTFLFYQLIVSIPSHTARPWFRACGLRGRVWARPAGRRRRATVHAPTAFIMERSQSPVSSSWDTSDSTEPKPRLQSTISTATTPLSMWLFKSLSTWGFFANAVL